MRLLNEIKKLLEDDDLGVRREVIYFLCLKEPKRTKEILGDLLVHEDPCLQTAAIAAMAEHQMEEANDLLTEETLEKFLIRSDEDAETGRVEVAKLLGMLEGEHYRVFLAQLMADKSPRVVKAAISSAGRKQDIDFVPHLMELLADSTYRPDAKAALADFGPRVLPILNDHLLSEDEYLPIRINIPSVVARIDSQESVDLLIDAILKVRPDLKFYVVKALNRLRNRDTGVKFQGDKLDSILVEETRSYYEIFQIVQLLPRDSTGSADKLLSRALSERLDLNLERIFRLLGLLYSPKDIFSAYLGITSHNRTLRASALEFLDNVLKGEAKRHLLPLLDGAPTRVLLSRGEELFNLRFAGIEEALEFLIKGRDPWLKSCALYCLVGRVPNHLRSHIRELSRDSNQLVSETARLTLAR